MITQPDEPLKADEDRTRRQAQRRGMTLIKLRRASRRCTDRGPYGLSMNAGPAGAKDEVVLGLALAEVEAFLHSDERDLTRLGFAVRADAALSVRSSDGTGTSSKSAGLAEALAAFIDFDRRAGARRG